MPLPVRTVAVFWLHWAMAAPGGFKCQICGSWHPGLPFAYGVDAPVYWRPEMSDDGTSELGDEQCVIRGEHFFVRGRVVLPVLDVDQSFEWGVWVSLSQANFARMTDLWDTPGREAERPYFGWLATELPVYTVSTLNLATRVVTQPIGIRPAVEVEPTDHPLSVERRAGITLDRVRQIASLLLHKANRPD